MRIKVKRNIMGYCFFMPALILVAVNSFWPFLGSFKYMFYRSNGLDIHYYVGMENFREMLTDNIFLNSFPTLAIYVTLTVFLATLGPLIGAKLLFSLKSGKLSYLFRILFVMPLIVPSMVFILIWKEMYVTEGAINQFFNLIGLEFITRSWLQDPNTALYAIIFTGIPFVGGTSLLIYLAGFLNIPKSHYEAARLEGAKWHQIMRYIEIPAILPQMRYILITCLIATVPSYTAIMVYTYGIPDSTMIPGLWLFKNAFGFGRLGYATALAFVLFVITFSLSVFFFKILRNKD